MFIAFNFYILYYYGLSKDKLYPCSTKIINKFKKRCPFIEKLTKLLDSPLVTDSQPLENIRFDGFRLEFIIELFPSLSRFAEETPCIVLGKVVAYNDEELLPGQGFADAAHP